MRRMFISGILILILLCMLTHPSVVIDGGHTGLELWYESVLPSILPFMIMTSLLLQNVRGKGICYLGLFCGLPVGANLVNQQYAAGHISSATANSLLCICNITSPMFISGYILNQTFQRQISAFRFFLAIYLPLLFFGVIFALKDRRRQSMSHFHNAPHTLQTISVSDGNHVSAASQPASLETVIRHSLQVILTVGIYIMLFCIIISFLLTVLPEHGVVPKLLTSLLEITNGIYLIMKLPIGMQQKTALIAGLTSFGGICSVLQTKSVLTQKGLSIVHYICIKVCMGMISYLLALLLF